MVFTKQIKKPFLFNPLKHHIEYARFIINNCSEGEELRIVKEFQKGGNLLCDFYYGDLTISEILSELEKLLHNREIFDYDSYKKFILTQEKNYTSLAISDHSVWTLLLGNENDRYVHIHPARHSPHTTRVRFLALKTAILLKYYHKGLSSEHLNFELINQIRESKLKASPVKKNGDISHLTKIMDVLDQYI